MQLAERNPSIILIIRILIFGATAVTSSGKAGCRLRQLADGSIISFYG
jgi:hypothetical protein